MFKKLVQQNTLQTNITEDDDSDSNTNSECQQTSRSSLSVPNNKIDFRTFSPNPISSNNNNNKFQQRNTFMVRKKSNSNNLEGSSFFKKFISRGRSEFIKADILEIGRLAEQVQEEEILKKQYVDIKNEEDQQMIIKILKKPVKSQAQMKYLAKSIEGLSLFQNKKEETIGSQNTLFQLCKHLSLKSFKKHDVIFNQGDFGKEYFIVINGNVLTLIKNKIIEEKDTLDVNQKSPTGNDFNLSNTQKYLKKMFKDFQHIFTYEPGTAFGEIALMTNEKRTATMVCEEDTQCMVLSREGFNTILKTALDKITNDKCNYVSQFSFFQNIARSNIDSFLHQINVTKFQTNCVIYNDKSPLDGQIYFVKTGEVLISTLIQNELQNKNEEMAKSSSELNLDQLNKHKQIKKNLQQIKRQTVVVKGPNTFFGEYEYLNNIPLRIHKAQVQTEAEIYCFNSKEIIQFFKQQNNQHNSLDKFIKESMISHNWEQTHLKIVNRKSEIIQSTQLPKQILQADMPLELARNVKREGFDTAITSSQHQNNQKNLLNEEQYMCKKWKKQTEEEKLQSQSKGQVPLNYLIKQNYKNQEEFQNHQLLQKKLEIIENQEQSYRLKSQSENEMQISSTLRKIKNRIGVKDSESRKVILESMPISYFQDMKNEKKRKNSCQNSCNTPTEKKNQFIIKTMNKSQHRQSQQSMSQEPCIINYSPSVTQNSFKKNSIFSINNNNNNQQQSPILYQQQSPIQQQSPMQIQQSPQLQSLKLQIGHKKSYSISNTSTDVDKNNYNNNNCLTPNSKAKQKQIQLIKQNLADQDLITLTPKSQLGDNSPSGEFQGNRMRKLSGFSSAFNNQNNNSNISQDKKQNNQYLNEGFNDYIVQQENEEKDNVIQDDDFKGKRDSFSYSPKVQSSFNQYQIHNNNNYKKKQQENLPSITINNQNSQSFTNQVDFSNLKNKNNSNNNNNFKNKSNGFQQINISKMNKQLQQISFQHNNNLQQKNLNNRVSSLKSLQKKNIENLHIQSIRNCQQKQQLILENNNNINNIKNGIMSPQMGLQQSLFNTQINFKGKDKKNVQNMTNTPLRFRIKK